MVKNLFKSKGVEYQEYGTDSEEYGNLIRRHGYIATVPVIEIGEKILTGYNPSLLLKNI